MKEAGRWLWDVRTPLRDGVELSVDLHLPPAGLAGGPYPAVLVRTAAGNQAAALVKRARVLADAGFAVALQDVRGREDSEGRFTPFLDEGKDGYDSVEWVAAQEWCSGKVAMMGSGYAGWTQWAAARERPPHLTALASTSAWVPGLTSAPGTLPLPMLAWLHAMSARVWQEAGQVDWDSLLRHLPLRDAEAALGARLPVWNAWLDAPLPGAYWDGLSADDFRTIDVPVLHVSGWHDSAQTSALHCYERMRELSPAAEDQVLVVGPWDHVGTSAPTQALGDVDFGAEAADDLDSQHIRWFQHWLTERSPKPLASRCFITGENTWRDQAWSGASNETATWFLRSHGELSSSAPGDEGHDSYRYDPAAPVLLTTDLTFFPSPPKRPAQIALDRRFFERRPDVLVYTSDELADGVELEGRPTVTLFVGSDRTDTDFFVQLSDVAPSGRSIAIATGGLRARSREGTDSEVFLVPGEVHELSLALGGIAHTVAPGHRLRLSITSGWFPLVDRNLNTGGRVGHEFESLVATNSVHHDAAHASRLELPLRRGAQ